MDASTGTRITHPPAIQASIRSRTDVRQQCGSHVAQESRAIRAGPLAARPAVRRPTAAVNWLQADDAIRLKPFEARRTHRRCGRHRWAMHARLRLRKM